MRIWRKYIDEELAAEHASPEVQANAKESRKHE